MKMENVLIWHLEDADLMAIHVGKVLTHEIKNAKIISFSSRLQMEAAWLDALKVGNLPKAIILDIFVPEKHIWVAHAIFGHPKSIFKKIKKAALYVIAIITALVFIKYFSKELKREFSDIYDEDEKIKRVFSGLAFLNRRLLKNDGGSVLFYIYSQAINKKFWEKSKIFGRFCQYADNFLKTLLNKNNINERNKLNINIYEKGYFNVIAGFETKELVEDRFKDLLNDLKQRL